ncbi:MAG: sigma-70 family RNA polymerase sigma factor [Planctomycetota bacterium]
MSQRSIDSKSVQALWEASSQRLRAWFLRKTGNPADADDLVQETFARVQAGLGQLQDRERLDAWVGMIAGNALADHGRRAARRMATLEGNDVSQPEAADEVETLRQAVAGWIEPFLERLDPADAALLRAVDLERRSQAEVARELGLAASSVRSRVQRARERLKQHLEACCAFAFDVRGNLTEATRRPGASCECDRSGGD